MKWFFGAILLVVIAWRFELGLLVLAGYAVLALVGVSRLLTLAWSRHLEADRVVSSTTRELGESLEVIVTIRNAGRMAIPWLLFEDGVPWSGLNAQPPALKLTGSWLTLVRFKPGATKTIRYEVQCLRRGYYAFGPVLAETGDLFGLQRSYRLLSEPQFVMVLPKVMSLESYDIESPRPIGEIRLAHRLFEDPTRISGVRSFQPGDALNRIHWRASARTGQLQSKTFESACVAGATIVLDFHVDSFLPRARYFCSELAVTLAASVSQALAQMSEQVGLVSNGRDAAERMKVHGWELQFRTREIARRALQTEEDNRRLSPIVVETRRDPNQFERILETLARLELTEEFSFQQMMTEVGPRLPRSASVLTIVSQISPETAAALGQLRRRGYTLLALVIIGGDSIPPTWAAPPEWAERLLQEGVPFRVLADEEAISNFCAEFLVTS